MQAIYKRVITEDTIVKDLDHKIVDTKYMKSIYLLGIKIFSHSFDCNQSIADMSNSKVGFKIV